MPITQSTFYCDLKIMLWIHLRKMATLLCFIIGPSIQYDFLYSLINQEILIQ